jgi:polyferredoxin
MKNHKIRLRSYILVALVIMLPILFSFYSPVIMAWGILNRIITLSALIFVTWFILSLFMGRSASCGYTCPYGALQEILGGSILKKKPKFEKADKIRYFIFVLFLLMTSYFILKGEGFKGVDLFASNGTYSILWINSAQLAILIPISIIAIGILSIIFGSRAFCRYLCPQGVFLTIGTKLGRKIKIPSLHLRSNMDNCSSCNLCDKSCPMGLNVSHMVNNSTMDNLNCILCGECIEKCPKEVINYSFSPKD